MAIDDLWPGFRRTQAIAVSKALTVAVISVAFASFADMPPVFATMVMVGFLRYRGRPRDRSSADVGRGRPALAGRWHSA